MPLPSTSFRIVDPDTYETLPVDEDGLILIGGNQVMLGSLDDPQRTADSVINLDDTLWYKTGDKGHIDKDGFLTIVDRYSRFAKIGGEMISLSAVEEGVREALESPELQYVAVAIPGEKKGEAVILFVSSVDCGDVAPPTLRRRVVGYGLNALMIPSRFELVEEIPTLASGKTDFVTAKKLANVA